MTPSRHPDVTASARPVLTDHLLDAVMDAGWYVLTIRRSSRPGMPPWFVQLGHPTLHSTANGYGANANAALHEAYRASKAIR